MLQSAIDFIHQFKDWLNPQTIIHEGGLWLLLIVIFAETGLFIGFFLPGDSLLFVAGLAIKLTANGKPLIDLGMEPVLTLISVILLTALAAIIGNFVGYFFGFTLGPRLFNREDSIIFKKKYLDMTQSFYDRHGRPALILGRFLPIIRTFVPILAGAIKMNPGRFAVYNIIGALLWVPLLITAGYLLGSIKWVEHNIEIIVILLIVVTIIPVIRTVLRERKKAKAKTSV
jgi:membrane-associated protein